jgi:predicted Co/Zn/Cd cation transporter (cation efflux family)
MIGAGALNGVVFVASVALVLIGIVRALMDGQRLWALGMAVATAIYAPLGVVLAIVYMMRVRRTLADT